MHAAGLSFFLLLLEDVSLPLAARSAGVAVRAPAGRGVAVATSVVPGGVMACG